MVWNFSYASPIHVADFFFIIIDFFLEFSLYARKSSV